MEERRLYNRLIRLYGVTVAAVLLMVFFAVGVLLDWDARTKNRETFSTLLAALSDQLYRNSYVSHSQLRAMERKNRLLLSIGDNGTGLLYNTGDGAEKRAAFAVVEELALADGYDTGAVPLTTQRRTSPVYAFRERGASYLGAVSILPLSGGYRTVTMVQRVFPLPLWKLALLAGGYLGSALLLCWAGRGLIQRALLPAAESRRRQTRFIAAASHELRSPLTVISMNAAAIRANAAGAEEPAPAAEAAAVIERESGRMSRLIADMLLLAAADDRSWPVSLVPLEADTVLMNVYETYGPVLYAEKRTLSRRLPDAPLPRALGDPGRLAQVLGILLDNALSYGVTEDRPAVELAAFSAGRDVCLTVADHGPGLSVEQKAQVFERFYRGDGARRDKQHFGLGLSIALELVRLQNGRLTPEDTPGGGCTFRVSIPRAD